MAKRAENPQRSGKAGVTSLAKTPDSTRHGFRTQPASRKVAGASGREDRVRGPRPDRAEAGAAGKGAALRKMKERRGR